MFNAIVRKNVDWNYVNKMELLNDFHWKNGERKLYFYNTNKELIIPTIIGSFVIFVTNHPFAGIPGVIMLIALVLWACARSNQVNLDKNPEIVKERESYRKFEIKLYMSF